MKYNKLIKLIIWIITLMPLIIIGVGLLTSLFTYRLNTGSFTGFNISNTIALTFDSLSLFGFSADVSGEYVNDYLGSGVFTGNFVYGIFNFVGIFDNIFISYDVTEIGFTSIYLFVNWYLNYILLIQVIMFIPRIIMWFINWCFDIVDSFSRKGGFRR